MVLFIKTHKATNKLNASRQPLAATRHLHSSSLIKVLLEARDLVVARGGFGCGRGDDSYLLGAFSSFPHRFLIVADWVVIVGLASSVGAPTPG